MNPREGVWEGQYIILLLPLDYYNILREVFCETKVLRYQTTKRLALAKIVIQHCERKCCLSSRANLHARAIPPQNSCGSRIFCKDFRKHTTILVGGIIK